MVVIVGRMMGARLAGEVAPCLCMIFVHVTMLSGRVQPVTMAGGSRKRRLNADARLTLSRAFRPFRARNWAAEMADFGAIERT
jgi:hypothetical protein